MDVKGESNLWAWAGRVVAATYRAAIKDGALGRAGRQGLDELSKSLVAFPDSIQSQESERFATPSEIAHKPSKGHGVHGDTRQPTPGEIAKQPPASQQQSDQGYEHEKDNGYSM